MRGPRISTVIATYNRAHLIRRAVTSVLAALSSGDEVIVVDDGSQDGTERVIAPYLDRVRYIRIPHGGVGAARNLGIREARNELLAFLDSDDEWLPGQIQLQRALLEARPDLQFCFTNFATLRAGKRIPKALNAWHLSPPQWEETLGPGRLYSTIAPLPPGFDDFQVYAGDLYLPLMQGCYFSTITLVARRSAVGDSCRFAEDITVYEDWEFTGHLAKQGPGAYLDCEAALQHSHAGPRLTDVDGLRRAVNSLLVLKRVWGSDAQILSGHRDAYRRMFERWEILRIRQLIACGRTREARAALRAEPRIGIFWPYRALATLPGTLAVPLTRAGRLARTVLKRGSLSEWFGSSGSCSPSAGTGPACREW